MDEILWCLTIKKGLEIIEPNDNLAQAYLLKAEEALETSRLAHSQDWQISAGYYTFYFSIYALLQKIGIKCEIHKCTIAFTCKMLENYFSSEELNLFNRAFNLRNDAQYYTDRQIDVATVSKILKSAPLFMIKCKDLINKISQKEIAEIRERIIHYQSK